MGFCSLGFVCLWKGVLEEDNEEIYIEKKKEEKAKWRVGLGFWVKSMGLLSLQHPFVFSCFEILKSYAHSTDLFNNIV